MQNRRRQRVNLGRFPEVNLAAARAERDRLTQAIKAGRSSKPRRVTVGFSCAHPLFPLIVPSLAAGFSQAG